MYLSSTVGAFLAVGSTAGGGPVPAGFDPDDAGFFLPKSGMSAKTHLLCQALLTLFQKQWAHINFIHCVNDQLDSQFS